MSCVGSPSYGLSTSKDSARSDRSSVRWVLAATILGSSIEFIDGTVVNIALPSIQGAYHATAIQTEWVVASYALCLSAGLLLAGALGDKFGQRGMFAIGILAFALSSSWCAFATSIFQLLIARSFQGIGGACLVANSLALLSNSTPPEFRGKAIGTWSAVVSLMTASGPVLGGWLVQHGSWRWVFLLNVPTAALALWITVVKTKEARPHRTVKGLDVAGACLGTLSLTGLTLGLIEWARTPRFGVAACLLGVLMLVAFLQRERTSRNPLLPLALFRNRVFTGTNLVTLLLYGALSPLLFYLPIKLIQIQGFSPQEAGASMLPLVLTLSVLSPRAGSLAQRVGARVMLSVGPLTAAIGLFLLAASNLSTSYWARIAPGLFLTGLGLALTVSPLTIAVMSSVENERAGIASGVNNTIAQVAALLALAISAPLFQHQFDTSLRAQLAANDVGTEDAALIWQHRNQLGAIATQNAHGKAAVDHAYAQSFAVVISLAGILTVLAGTVAALSLRGQSTIRANRSTSDPGEEMSGIG
jgi:EmrB/QacA subfamily drug resistance transporter